jgi:ribose 5-phosphate isomerase B
VLEGEFVLLKIQFQITMMIHIGADHAGFEMKNLVKETLLELGHTVEDHGTHSAESTDYPDYAHAVALAVEQQEGSMGILLCGSANGVSMTANKHAGIRAALCWTPEIAALARQHNDANVLCIPARFVTATVAREMVRVFLSTLFEGGRHQKRVEKIGC